MVGLLTITGGVSLAGAWVYKRWGDKKQKRQAKDAGQTAEQPWWKVPWQTVQETLQRTRQRFTAHDSLLQTEPVTDALSPAFVEHMAAPNAAIQYGLRTSTLALGLTTTGWLVFPPLQIAGLPLLVYMGIPPAQAAYDQLWVNGRPSRALAETVALVACLAGGYYWVGSLGFWLYYGGWSLLAEKRQSEDARRPDWWAPTTTHLWQDGAACAVPTATLHPGDQVILHSGEMVPVDGLITEGVAWLRPQALLPGACGVRKGVGDKIAATELVLVGRVCVRVLRVA